MVGSQIPWTWVAVGALLSFVVILSVLLWRMRRIRDEEQEALRRQQEVMAQRLAEVEKAPPLSVPPALRTRPEETWLRHTLPRKRYARKDP